MRTTTRPLAVLILTGMILALAAPALWADSALLPGANIFGVNPNANGTKVSGPLAIYYLVTSTTACGTALHEVDMFFVMRLKLGTDSFAFAPAGPTRLCYENTNAQRTAIEGFITSTVIPLLFPQSTSPSWDLKSVTNFHQDSELQNCPIDPVTQACKSFWAVMDITLAVRP